MFNTNSLQSILESVMPSATICTITTLTSVKMNKRGNPYKDTPILKYAVRNCQFGYNYENAVNNHIERAGGEREFKAESLPWGEWIVPNKTIGFKGNVYGRFYVLPNAVVKSAYIIDGRVATKEEEAIIKSFETNRVSSSRQEEKGLAERAQVKPYTLKLENILKVVWGGNEWVSEEYASATAIATK